LLRGGLVLIDNDTTKEIPNNPAGGGSDGNGPVVRKNSCSLGFQLIFMM
jgi:hypothetical protein